MRGLLQQHPQGGTRHRRPLGQLQRCIGALTRPAGWAAASFLGLMGWAAPAFADVDENPGANWIREAGWTVVWRSWHLYPSIVLGLLVSSALYTWRVRVLSRRGEAPPAWRIAAFFGGLVTLFLALCSGLDVLSDIVLQSAHMVQHMLLMFIAAPLLLIGIKRVAEGLPAPLPQWLAALTQPIFAVGASFAIMYGWHFPALYDLAVRHEPIHVLEHVMFIGAGFLMWWPVIEPIEDLPRRFLPQMARILYLLVQHFPMFPLILIFMTADQLFYQAYGQTPRLLGFTPISDQVGAGIVMLAFTGFTFIVSVTPELFRLLENSGPSEEEQELIRRVMAQQEEAGERPRE